MMALGGLTQKVFHTMHIPCIRKRGSLEIKHIVVHIQWQTLYESIRSMTGD